MFIHKLKPYLSLLLLSSTMPCYAAIDKKPLAVETITIYGSGTSIDKDKVSCGTVRGMMAQVGRGSKIEEIYRIQDVLPVCLPQTDHETALVLLKDYDAMYNRFLEEGLKTEEEVRLFNDLAYELENGGLISKASLATLNPHLQYLLKLSQSDEDVHLKDLGEWFYTFSHDLSAMVSLFAPYLSKQDRVFVQRMAKDNQHLFWNDAAIAISFEELIQRALFWEDYLQRYPNSSHIKEAKWLYDTYRYTLFFGSDNTGWTDDAMHYFIKPKYNWLMIELSHRPNSQLAKDAKKFLAFMATSDIERRGYIEPNDHENQYLYDISMANKKADEVMQIPNIWLDQQYDLMHCFSSIFCYERDY